MFLWTIHPAACTITFNLLFDQLCMFLDRKEIGKKHTNSTYNRKLFLIKCSSFLLWGYSDIYQGTINLCKTVVYVLYHYESWLKANYFIRLYFIVLYFLNDTTTKALQFPSSLCLTSDQINDDQQRHQNPKSISPISNYLYVTKNFFCIKGMCVCVTEYDIWLIIK